MNVLTKMASKSRIGTRPSQVPRTAPATPLNKSPLKMSVVSPFTECRFCKREFGSASISIHEKQCEKKQAHAISSRSGVRVAERHRDIGPSRPKTRTLKRDVLTRGGGDQPPLIKPNSFSVPTLNCAECGTVIPSTKMLVHLRVCNPPTFTHEVVEVQCPLNGGRHDCKAKTKSKHTSTSASSAAAFRRPRTIICYICGREYGSKSISIHEPQCLKKWHIENNKLPIRERKPPPVKPAAKTATSTANAFEDMPLPALTRSEGKPASDEMMEAYFQNCYQEFEKELMPCGRCGRKFAPERYNRHTQNCNAQPLN